MSKQLTEPKDDMSNFHKGSSQVQILGLTNSTSSVSGQVVGQLNVH